MPPASRLQDYFQRIHLSTEQRAQLGLAAGEMPVAANFQQLQQQLAGQNAPVPAGALDTMATRLRALEPAAPIETDQQGRTRLATTPIVTRSKMLPEPLAHDLLQRLRRWLGGARDPVSMPSSPDPQGRWRFVAARRRLILLMLCLGQTVGATYLMTSVLPYHGAHPLELAVLVVYAILFFWISAGFWTALSGCLLLLLGRDRFSINSGVPGDAFIAPEARTAIVIPICNENVARVFAGLRATYASLARTGQLEHFDFFVLSDSSDPDTRVAEMKAWLEACHALKAFGRLFYRRRTHRIKRKSGNIADFCRRWGRAYRYMVVLDADSVMSGACLVRLTQLMEANPNAGIIQTAPQASGRETLYGRIQQFAHRVYGPLFTAGLHFWQLGESHYWGHNAIIRVAPFIRHCALPRLPGSGAFGGDIMSHDFVEAALMRRAGWAVWIAYDLPGSFEEMPPTLLDELKRDRRWCLGNLQNFRLFLAKGLHPAHRAVFMTGVMAYLSAPLWFLFLMLSTALLAVHTLVPPTYFTEPYQLFPTWPQWRPEWAAGLFIATAGLLFLPKLLSMLLLLRHKAQRRLYGGSFKIVVSIFGEMIFSALLAPIRMLFHTQYVVSAFMGWRSGWKSPPREDAQTGWWEAFSHHSGGTLLGILWAGFVVWLNPAFLWWLLPVVGSMIAAIPISVWSSRRSLGLACREGRLFLIPEEATPPRELRAVNANLRRSLRQLPVDFSSAALDPRINALMSLAARPRKSSADRARRQKLVQQALIKGPVGLNEHEQAILLNDPVALSQLHTALWDTDTLPAIWATATPDSRHD